MCIETESEWNYINNMAKIVSNSLPDIQWYIGLRKYGSADWGWENGKKSLWSKKGEGPWDSHNPSGTGDYVKIWKSGDNFVFDDVKGNVLRGYICEYKDGTCRFLMIYASNKNKNKLRI